jgi:hypothetical protein
MGLANACKLCLEVLVQHWFRHQNCLQLLLLHHHVLHLLDLLLLFGAWPQH